MFKRYCIFSENIKARIITFLDRKNKNAILLALLWARAMKNLRRKLRIKIILSYILIQILNQRKPLKIDWF